MFKLFQRSKTGSNAESAVVVDQQPRDIRSPIADVEYVGGTAVATLTITDLCTGSGVEQLADLLYEMANSGRHRLVLDMQNVQAIDSACLGCLVNACNHLSDNGVRLAVANAGKTVHQVFKLTRLDRVFPICTNVMAAIETVERRQSSDDE